ncbi:CopM family metallochaperone [Methylorubrum extorquens]
MTDLRTLVAVALLSAGLAGHAMAQGMHSHGGKEMPGNPSATHDDDMMKLIQAMKPDPKDPASTKDFKAADMTMMHDMHVPYTGNADVDFLTHMIPHHKGAVAMAKVALKHAKDPTTKAMAQKIIDDQEKEISDMEAWLKQHGK